MRIAIIGAGPIGCYLAHLLKDKDPCLQLNLIEEHATSGEPLHCAGLVSKAIFSKTHFRLPKDVIINHIDGAEIHFDSDSFLINKKEVAVVLDRRKFDYCLSQNLDILYNRRFMGLEKHNHGYLVQTDKGDIYADIVISAEGANSLLRKIINNPEETIQYYPAAQMRFQTSWNIKRNIVQVYLRKPYFGWIIPETDKIMRIGVIGKNPYHELTEFLRQINLEGKVIEKFGGVLPLGFCNTQKDNLFLVGDAACQVKPLTHGGLYYGMRCAEILCDCIIQRRLYKYEESWRSRFGKEIEIGLKVKRLYESLDKVSLFKIFKLLKENKDILEKFANFDRHSEIIFKLIRISSFQQLLGRLLLKLI